MGMLNNPWFRVKIHKTTDAVTNEVTLTFEHPTLAGKTITMTAVTLCHDLIIEAYLYRVVNRMRL